MQIYKAKGRKFSGSDFKEVHKKAYGLYSQLKKKTKRRPYVRSAYFNKEKIFLDFFWRHLFEKENWRDRMRRMKYFGCAVELIKNRVLNQNQKKILINRQRYYTAFMAQLLTTNYFMCK